MVTVQPVGNNYEITAHETTWDLIMGRLVDNGRKPQRDVVAHALTDSTLPTPTPSTGEVKIRVSPSVYDEIYGILPWDDHRGGPEFTEELEPITEAEAPAPRVERPRMSGVKKQNECACGCGTMTASKWAPGHDSRAKSKLIKRVDNEADEDAAAEMVERGWWKPERAEARLEAAAEKLRDQ